ncbi:ZIP family metal transporter [Chryseolinea sp. H1M3-3]|uniref:ZIP family metal transporter n=1 Tax=Chryseolinea sp. H1M3-3 TaxID=3034144 RepID=UPI0023EB162C|nr:ZIP family metal transporter [Chryseolinea sp. H1M3-3]
MELLIDFFSSIDPLLAALVATIFTWALTALGASLVFLFADMSRKMLDIMLGFTGGVMVAASFWSLLSPAIEISGNLGVPSWFPAASGFFLGAMFLYGLDKLLPHLHLNFLTHEKEGVPTSWHKTILMVLAITLHNIPEGLAVGIAFGAAAANVEGAEVTGAIALAIGIGLQNFPEGTAIAVPLRGSGLSRSKSFFWGQLSAAVEPVAGVAGAAFVIYFTPILPYALAFAAGAMMYVVVEEVIPETQRDKYADFATLGFIGGFIIMMVLDVGLG